MTSTYPPTLPPRSPDADIDALCAAHVHAPSALLDVLRTIARQRGRLVDADLRAVAVGLRVPASQVGSVARFYALLPGAAPAPWLRVCDGPTCTRRGGRDILATARAADPAGVSRVSCLGLCDRAPAALAGDQQLGPLVPALPLSEAVRQAAGPCARYETARPGEHRVLLAEVATDPEAFVAARRRGAYEALDRALAGDPEAVLVAVERAGLRGRGGAGYPTARKWRAARGMPGPRVVICNADESEPLAFKDRVLLDAAPHLVIEGIALACYASGADQALVYVRGEYEPQARRLEAALAEARSAGALGALDVTVHRGAGAYICGEETALLESLEGRRGEPRLRPPYPATVGLHGRPTVVNNVETLACVPGIVAGAAAVARTKLWTITGHVRQPGLVEAPLGLTLRRAIDDLAGGVSGAGFGFALVGGAAGVFADAAMLDAPMDYGPSGDGRRLAPGGGALLVCDRTVAPLTLLAELLWFFEHESCGKCTPCRIGTREARRLCEGTAEGPSRLAILADVLERTSFCGLGQSAAWPLRSALERFPDAFAEKAPPGPAP